MLSLISTVTFKFSFSWVYWEEGHQPHLQVFWFEDLSSVTRQFHLSMLGERCPSHTSQKECLEGNVSCWVTCLAMPWHFASLTVLFDSMQLALIGPWCQVENWAFSHTKILKTHRYVNITDEMWYIALLLVKWMKHDPCF